MSRKPTRDLMRELSHRYLAEEISKDDFDWFCRETIGDEVVRVFAMKYTELLVSNALTGIAWKGRIDRRNVLSSKEKLASLPALVYSLKEVVEQLKKERESGL